MILGLCPVVATNTERAADITNSGLQDSLPVSGAEVLGLVGDDESPDDVYPIVASPVLTIRPERRLRDLWRLVRTMGELPSITSLADPQDLPARACLRCQHPLPVDLDDRRIVTIAVLGTKGSGKTHYLATMIHQASRLQGLAEVGCETFAPDEPTAREYQLSYFDPLFVQKRQLNATDTDERVRFSPLVYRVEFAGAEPVSLLFHDISGEMLENPMIRARYAQFVTRSDGAIFLVDPEQLAVTAGHRQPVGDMAASNQADLLIGWLNSLTAPVPLAIAISKADVIDDIFPGKYAGLARPSPRKQPEWGEAMSWVAEQVSSLLKDFQAFDLLAAVRRGGGGAVSPPAVSLHAVAALGAPPLPDETVPQILALRCLDPLITVLSRIPGVTQQRPE
jgi:hypothetical protein